MTPIEVLVTLVTAGVRLRRLGGELGLSVAARTGEVPPQAIALARQHKTALLAMLPPAVPATLPPGLPPAWYRVAERAGSITWLDQALLWPPEVRETWLKRAAIIEHVERLPRSAAEACAYLELRCFNVTSFLTVEPSSPGDGVRATESGLPSSPGGGPLSGLAR